MSQTERLDDRWHTREYPVLVATARLLDDGQRPLQVRDIQQHTDVEFDQIIEALRGLVPGYLDDKPLDTMGGTIDFIVKDLTERGRRKTGLWPEEDAAADALIELLEQAADGTADEDDAGALRKAGRLLKSVPGNVLADVTAALIRQQAGI